jgi:hypothetical protein
VDDGDTPPTDVAELPGYGPGFIDGYRLGLARAIECFRLALIESGTDPGRAFLLAEKLTRWISAHGG